MSKYYLLYFKIVKPLSKAIKNNKIKLKYDRRIYGREKE